MVLKLKNVLRELFSIGWLFSVLSLLLKIMSCCFSSPANVLPMQSANAVSFATLPPSQYSEVFRSTYKMILAGIFASHRAMVWIQSFFDSTAFETNYAYFRMLKIMDLPKHQLYLYSNADDICSDHSIEEFLKLQQERGMMVQSKCWESSAHVQHLRAHPEEYTQCCENFVSDVINSP